MIEETKSTTIEKVVTVQVPEGNYCPGCSFLETEDIGYNNSYCILFKKKLFDGRKKDFSWVGSVKCEECIR